MGEVKRTEILFATVGDELYSEFSDSYCAVVKVDAWNRYEVISSTGSCFLISDEIKKYWKKTGKNYPQIKEVLEALSKK